MDLSTGSYSHHLVHWYSHHWSTGLFRTYNGRWLLGFITARERIARKVARDQGYLLTKTLKTHNFGFYGSVPPASQPTTNFRLSAYGLSLE